MSYLVCLNITSPLIPSHPPSSPLITCPLIHAGGYREQGDNPHGVGVYRHGVRMLLRHLLVREKVNHMCLCNLINPPKMSVLLATAREEPGEELAHQQRCMQ